MIDTHAHLNFEVFKDSLKEMVEKSLNEGVEKIIVVGTDFETSKKAVDIAEEYDHIYAAVGVHPHHVKGLMKTDQVFQELERLEELLGKDVVVAVGEIGLDKHVYRKTRYKMERSELELDRMWDLQVELFDLQLKLAAKNGRPVIIHSREVGDEVLKRIGSSTRGVFHCFEGSKKYARQILDAGFLISFTGNITYAEDRSEVASMIPLDRLLLETDSPYMTPVPYRGLVNYPGNVKIIASHHAKSRNIDIGDVIEQTSNNAKSLFGL